MHLIKIVMWLITYVIPTTADGIFANVIIVTIGSNLRSGELSYIGRVRNLNQILSNDSTNADES